MTNTNDTLVLAGRESAEWLRAEQHFGAADLMIEMADAIMTLRTALAAANERADGLQRIVDEARAQKPVCITTLDDFCTVVAYPPPNVLHSVPLYAAPVPSLPAVVPTYEIVMSSGRKARLTAPELVDRLAACTVEIERLRGERKTQPAADCWTQDQIDHVRTNASELFKGAASKPLAEDARHAISNTHKLSTTEGRKDD